MGWGEALRLVRILRADPSSMLAASVEGWRYPMTHEALILADLFDLQQVTGGVKRPEKYPRPFGGEDRKRSRRGNVAGRSREEVLAILAAHGH